MTLADTQLAMMAWLASGDDGVGAFVPPRSRRGLAVYAHAYRATLIGTLREAFEKTHAWLGDDGFDDAARAHIATYPPSSWTLSDYGASFADTLAKRHPDDPEIADLAMLDWSLRRAFDGPDASTLDPATLVDVDWDAAIIDVVPTAIMVPITTNAPAIWIAIADGETPPSAQSLDNDAALLVWRDGLQPRYRTIDAIEAEALRGALDGKSFGTICERISAASPNEADERAGAMLGQWITDGLICRVRG